MNIKQFFRKIVLNILLVFFKVGAIFHWEYAEDQCEDLELALNDDFIEAMRKMVRAIDENDDFDISKVKEYDISEIFKS